MGHQFFPWPWGVSIGGSGGALSVVVYKKAKSIITNLKNVDPV